MPVLSNEIDISFNPDTLHFGGSFAIETVLSTSLPSPPGATATFSGCGIRYLAVFSFNEIESGPFYVRKWQKTFCAHQYL